MTAHGFNEEYRFGSAAWADSTEISAAGLFRKAGPQIGFVENRPFYLESDAPMITIGGAGSGKLRDLLGYVVCNTPDQRMIVLDPRGELAAISMAAHAMHGEHAYLWNPFGLHGLPQHACNPLAILDPASPTFHADAKFAARALVAISPQGEGKYFEQRAASWIEAFLKFDADTAGGTSLPRLMRLVNLVESGSEVWPDVLKIMLGSTFDDVRRTAGEILVKQQDSPREFGSILGEIYASLSFLDDPTLQQSLEGDGFSLEVLNSASRAAKVFLIVPAEYLKIFAPVLRLFFAVTLVLKGRVPSSPRVMMLVDEAGQLGSFDALLQSFTYGRGAGIRSWAIFQDVGQIIRNFGPPGLTGFMGSAQMRQFFGVRDYQTAKAVSDMLGSETLEYLDPRLEEQARAQKGRAMQRFMQGEDPFAAAFEVAHFARAARIKTKQARKLMTEEEILAMPEDRQIIFISGKDLKPVFAQKFPYFTRSEMAGLYLPNPYHPPTDSVPVVTWRGTRRFRVIRERAPHEFASYPQFQNGSWAYVEGYKPTS
ncbi:MAG: type IV secretory system conjugative DNA transfer family protein [Alphaproteobacteria bacterium]|nr:type IV secretory system conjugative DNA transfer family protein [Alphaproteobacteria bacterium]